MRKHKTIRVILRKTAFCLVLAAIILPLIILPAGCGGTNSNHTPGTVGIFIERGPTSGSISADDSNYSIEPFFGATTVAQVWIRVSKIEAVTFDGVSTVVIWDANDHPIAPPVDLLRHAFMPQFLGFATIPLGKYSKLMVELDDDTTSSAPYFIPYNATPNYPYDCVNGLNTNCGLVLNANLTADPSANTSAGTPFTFTFSPTLTIDDGSRGNIVIDFTPKIHYDDTTDVPGSPTPTGTPATPTPTPTGTSPTPTATPSPGTPTPHYVLQANSTTADANPSYYYGTNLLYVPMTVLGTTCSEGFLTARLDTQVVTVLVDQASFLIYDGDPASCGDVSPNQTVRVTGVLTSRHQLVAGRVTLPFPLVGPEERIGSLRKDPTSGDFYIQTGENYGEHDDRNLLLDLSSATILDERVDKVTPSVTFSNNQYVAVTGTVTGTVMAVDTIRIFLDEDQ